MLRHLISPPTSPAVRRRPDPRHREGRWPGSPTGYDPKAADRCAAHRSSTSSSRTPRARRTPRPRRSGCRGRHQLLRQGVGVQGRVRRTPPRPWGPRGKSRRRGHPGTAPPRAPYRLANSGWIDAAVVNAGYGTHQHPTQALAGRLHHATPADRPRLAGPARTRLRQADSPSSATSCTAGSPRSNVDLLHPPLGAEVRVLPHRPAHAGAGRCRLLAVRAISYDLGASCARCDAVMMLRVQRERISGLLPHRAQASRRFTASTATAWPSCPSTPS